MKLSHLLIAIASILLIGNLVAVEYQPYWANTKKIDEDWLYLERDTAKLPSDSDAAYEPISLPHTWNALDTLETKDYRKAASWYRKNVTVTEEQLKQRQYIRFNAAGQQARVYLNGEELTHHVGGYSAFTCELTDKLKVGSNRLDVWVSNKVEGYLAPLSGDFNFYGGLYRSVQWITGPEISISRKHFGGPGYRVWSEAVSDASADVNVTLQIDNGSARSAAVVVAARVLDAQGNVVSVGKTSAQIAQGATQLVQVPMPAVVKPTLWSPESPALYRVELKVMKDGKAIDETALNYGFRWFKFTVDKGFFLNGKPYKLRGANRHQDFEKKGNALSLEDHLNDVKFMKEAGINWLRMAHYQQHDYMMQLCDQMGILVWEEIPYVNKGKGESFEKTLHSMMKDMIEQHFNHVSIILWGMGNETWIGDRGDGKAQNYDLIKGINDLAHSEDPVRKTVFVVGDNDSAALFQVADIPDVFGYNLYRGWYGKTHHTSLIERLEQLRDLSPERPLILSEFGAGSDLTVHSEKPRKKDFTIEYQNEFLESHLDQIDQLDWLAGVNWWAFFDFGAAHRGDTMPHINQKGVITFDRKHKKDAFYLLKSRWTDDPVVHIESETWTKRGGKAQKEYRVYSNMDEVEFFHNGKSLGKQTKGFTWKVTLIEDGENKLLAKGKSGDVELEHGYTVHFGAGAMKYNVSATAEEGTNPARHLVDENPKTRWSAKGNQQINLDLKKISLVNGVTILFHKGKERQYTLAIKGSVDGKEWTPLFDGQSQSAKEMFKFAEQQEIRYLQIDAKGSSINKWNSYNEIMPDVTLEKQKKNLYERVGSGKKL